jgi:hypothetical protein
MRRVPRDPIQVCLRLTRNPSRCALCHPRALVMLGGSVGASRRCLACTISAERASVAGATPAPRHERITATFSLNHTRDAGSSSPVARPALNAATPSRCTSLHALRTRTVECAEARRCSSPPMCRAFCSTMHIAPSASVSSTRALAGGGSEPSVLLAHRRLRSE